MVPFKALRIALVLFVLLVIIEADDKDKGTDNNGKKESGVTETKGDENGKKNGAENGEKKQPEAKVDEKCKKEGDVCVAGQCCANHVCFPYKEGEKEVRKCKKEQIPTPAPGSKVADGSGQTCLNEGSRCDPANNQCCGKIQCYTSKTRRKISVCRKYFYSNVSSSWGSPSCRGYGQRCDPLHGAHCCGVNECYSLSGAPQTCGNPRPVYDLS